MLRNDSAHPGIEQKRLETAHDKVAGYHDIVEAEYGLDAPNLFQNATFEDHLLYTRIVKYVATDLCRLAPPVTADELRNVLACRDRFTASPAQTVLLRRGDDEILTRALRTFLFTHCRFRLEKHGEAERELVCWLNKLLRRRERRRAGRPKLGEALAAYIADGI